MATASGLSKECIKGDAAFFLSFQCFCLQATRLAAKQLKKKVTAEACSI